VEIGHSSCSSHSTSMENSIYPQSNDCCFEGKWKSPLFYYKYIGMNSFKIRILILFNMGTDQPEYRSSDVLVYGATKSCKTDLFYNFVLCSHLASYKTDILLILLHKQGEVMNGILVASISYNALCHRIWPLECLGSILILWNLKVHLLDRQFPLLCYTSFFAWEFAVLAQKN
jgi:hypothetical protein